LYPQSIPNGITAVLKEAREGSKYSIEHTFRVRVFNVTGSFD
jgi:hypothetical protein